MSWEVIVLAFLLLVGGFSFSGRSGEAIAHLQRKLNPWPFIYMLAAGILVKVSAGFLAELTFWSAFAVTGAAAVVSTAALFVFPVRGGRGVPPPDPGKASES